MPENLQKQKLDVSRIQRETQKQQKGKVIWLMGLSGSGKSTLANLLDKELFERGYHSYVLDGDNVRLGLNKDVKFTREDRKENLRRAAEVAKLFVDAGLVVIASFITPLEKDRKMVEEIIGKQDLLNVFVDCPLQICEKRDPKGLYAKARAGIIINFTGINAPFEIPRNANLRLVTDNFSTIACLNKLLSLTLHNVKSDNCIEYR